LTAFRASQRGVYQELMHSETVASRDVAEAQACVTRLMQEVRSRKQQKRAGRLSSGSSAAPNARTPQSKGSAKRGSPSPSASIPNTVAKIDAQVRMGCVLVFTLCHGCTCERVCAEPRSMPCPTERTTWKCSTTVWYVLALCCCRAQIKADGGPTGGWASDDHRAFMAVMAVHKQQVSQSDEVAGDSSSSSSEDQPDTARGPKGSRTDTTGEQLRWRVRCVVAFATVR